MIRVAIPGVARGVALFFGLFSLLNVLGELRTPGFDANGWWIDFRPLSRYILPELPYYMLREVAALWVYYLRPLVSHDSPKLERFSRNADDTWMLAVASGLDQLMALPSIGVTLPLARVYAKVELKPETFVSSGLTE